jgi:hypothetical protein
MINVEFHCHTRYSKDSLVKIPDLLATCKKKGLDRLVVTDHNNILGAREANALDPDRFIIGEEIMTQQGELLGIFVQEHIPSGLDAVETIDILRSQSAFISVSHPFDVFRKGHWDENDLLNILPRIDAIEVFNSRCMDPQFNKHAQDFASQHHLLGTVGSDSHSLGEVGTASLTLPGFSDTTSLIHALQMAHQNIHLSPPWVHFYSRYAAWRKKIAA